MILNILIHSLYSAFFWYILQTYNNNMKRNEELKACYRVRLQELFLFWTKEPSVLVCGVQMSKIRLLITYVTLTLTQLLTDFCQWQSSTDKWAKKKLIQSRIWMLSCRSGQHPFKDKWTFNSSINKNSRNPMLQYII